MYCQEEGHWKKVCKKRIADQKKGGQPRQRTTAVISSGVFDTPDVVYPENNHVSSLNTSTGITKGPSDLSYAIIPSYINGQKCSTLIDTGASRGVTLMPKLLIA